MTKSGATALQGVGIGLRSQHYAAILQARPDIAWLEALTDNYLEAGPPRMKLLRMREHHPIALHGVGLSIGSTDPLNQQYLRQVKVLIDAVQPVSISDHLCWTSVGGCYSHELLPLPYTRETLAHICTRVETVQEAWQRPILLENITQYLNFPGEFSEPEFLNALAKHTGCGLLLDINNIYVNAANFGFEPLTYLQAIDKTAVKQFHLGGYETMEDILVDTHGAAVYPDVWALYQAAVAHFGALPTCIEWDNQVPGLSLLLAEAEKAKQHLMERVCN